MKKIFCVLLVISVLLMMCSCGSNINNENNDNEQKEEITCVELDSSNIEDYLAIDISYDEINSGKILGIPFLTTNANIKIYPIRPGSFSNTKMSLEISCPTGWTVEVSDRAYKESNNSKMFIDVTLPADGYYSTKVEISSVVIMDYNMNRWSNFALVTSASGTFNGN